MVIKSKIIVNGKPRISSASCPTCLTATCIPPFKTDSGQPGNDKLGPQDAFVDDQLLIEALIGLDNGSFGLHLL